mgnify:CR=1 FL=1
MIRWRLIYQELYMEITMKRTTKKNLETAILVGANGFGFWNSIRIIKKATNQALPQINEASGWKKVWFIFVAVGVDIFYTWCAFRCIMGTIHEVVDRLVEKHESVWGPFVNRVVEESEEEEGSSQNSKIKDYHDQWSTIRGDDDQVVMPR